MKTKLYTCRSVIKFASTKIKSSLFFKLNLLNCIADVIKNNNKYNYKYKVLHIKLTNGLRPLPFHYMLNMHVYLHKRQNTSKTF